LESTFYHLWANKYWRNSERATWVPATDSSPEQVRQSSFLELYHIQKQTGNRTTLSYSQVLGSGFEGGLVVGGDINRISYPHGTATDQVPPSRLLTPYHHQKQTGPRPTQPSRQVRGSAVHGGLGVGGDISRISDAHVSNPGNNATRLVALSDPIVGEFIHQPG